MGSLPSGNVTFLFTDIEGSTRLWENHTEPMRRSLARHDALLREVCLRRGGYVFKTVGDAFCVAFDAAPDALHAALEAQRVLAREAWEVPGGIRVRMALHSGIAEERGGDYFGPTLNRAARLLSLGAGGQTLLSLVTTELVRDHLPEKASLRGLGGYRLKDLLRPEDVFQLDHPDLRAGFPPLRSLNDVPNNLPLQPTPFLGREKELAVVRPLLADAAVRLVTLTGIGGAGKTRLALQAAADVLDAFPGGVWFVDLASVRDPQLFHATVARAAGVRDPGGGGTADALKAAFHDRNVLLILDNFEQVMDAAPLAVDLAAALPRLKALVTSREALHARGEHVLPVPPLAVPSAAEPVTAATLGQYEAVALFIQRACAVRPDFRVTNSNAPAVAEICTRLEGHPLALELAAARIAVLSPEALLKRLEDRLRILTGGFTDLPARQRTLRATIDWSHELLSTEEQALFRRLAVFEGSFPLEAAESVCAGTACPDVLEDLTSLAGKNLIGREDPDGEAWFRMPAVVREYARERLEAAGDAAPTMQAHAEFHGRLAAEAYGRVRGPERTPWMDRLERSQADLRAAVLWLLAHSRGGDALSLCADLGPFWQARGFAVEGERLTEQALAAAAAAPAGLRGRALLAAGNLAEARWNHAEAIRRFTEALGLLASSGDRENLAHALVSLGWSQYRILAREEAKASFSRPRAEGLSEDRLLLANADNGLAVLAMDDGRLEEADALLRRSLEVFRSAGDDKRLAQTTGNLAMLRRRMGDLAEAARLYAEAIAVNGRIGDRSVRDGLLNNLGDLRMRMGDFLAAEGCYAELLEAARKAGNLSMECYARTGIADARLRRGMGAEGLESARAAREAARNAGGGPELGVSLRALGDALLQLGDRKAAAACYEESIPLLHAARFPEDEKMAKRGLLQARKKKED